MARFMSTRSCIITSGTLEHGFSILVFENSRHFEVFKEGFDFLMWN